MYAFHSIVSFRWRLVVGMFVSLSCLYLLTYSSYMEAIDTRYLFNGVASLVHFGDWREDLTADDNFPTPTNAPANSVYPLKNLIDDPLTVIVATPLYWLADKLPGVGLVHTVWLFNIFVTAAGACVLFAYVLTLGYDERVGVLAALAFGATTIVWTYSKTFFQENFTLLITMSLALALERWRRSGFRSWRALLVAIVLAVCLPYSKWSSVIAAPGLLLVAVPVVIKRDSRVGKPIPLVEVILLAGIIVAMVLLGYTGLWRVLPGIDWFNSHVSKFQIAPQYIQPAIQSYLFSIGASIWGTSPIVLLALPGCWMLLRQGRTRYLWVMVVVLVAYALGYAMLRGIHWFSGLSWPPRFLVPTMPFLMLCTLPVLQWMVTPLPSPLPASREREQNKAEAYIRAGKRLMWVIFGVLALYGVWIQLSGLSLRWTVYPTLLPPDAGVSWGGGYNSLAYLRWVLLPRAWGQFPFDFVWVRTEQPLWPLMFAALGVVSVVWLLRTLHAGTSHTQSRLTPGGVLRSRYPRLTRGNLVAAALGLALLAGVYVGLRLIYHDPEYIAYNTALFDMLPIVEAETQPGDVVLITAREHLQFLLNYGKSERWRGIGVSYLPGERYDPNSAPLVSATTLVNPTAEELTPLLAEFTPWLVEQLAGQHERLWLWADFGPDMPWAVRPLERYLTRLYYPVQEMRTAPAVRLLEYDTTPAPVEAETDTDIVFGDTIRLTGYALPRGTEYTAGENLPITLFWQAEDDVTQDYTVALFLGNDTGTAAQGMDSAPDGGFSYTSLWLAGTRVQDNRLLRLPDTLAAGAYQLWLVLYPTGSDGSQRLSISGGEARDDTIAVLPVTITVR